MSDGDLRQKAITFVRAIPAGALPGELVAAGFFAWTSISGRVEREEFVRRVGLIGQVFTDAGLRFTVDRTTAEGSSVVVQVRGEGMLFTGERYQQSYLYVVEFDEAGQVRHLREYFDTHIVHTLLRPAMERWARERAAAA